MLRILGALCILIGAGAAGFGFAASVRRQARQLGELCAALEAMRCEIEYRMTPLPQLLEQLAQTCATPVGELLLHWSRMLSDGDGATVSYALRRAMESVRGLELPPQAVQELSDHRYLRGTRAGRDFIVAMEIDLIFKIAAVGIIVSILNQVLVRSGREEQATMTSLAGLVVVLMIVVQRIADLFDLVKNLFHF